MMTFRCRYRSMLLSAGVVAALLVSGCAGHAGVASWHSGSGTGSSSASASAPPSASPSAPACDTAGMLAGWSVTRLAEQTVVVPVDEGGVGAVTSQVAAGAGGVILFGSRAPAGLAQSLAKLSAAAPGGIPPLVMSDEEGGAVQRMANLVGVLPSARQMGATMTAAQIQNLAQQAGRKLRAAGVTMDLAPVLDLDDGDGPTDADAIGTRSFSRQEKTATADGLAFAAGLRAGGVIPVVKHFPGLGGATANTDVAPAYTRAWSTIARDDLLPFRAAAQAGLPVMVANARIPGLTSTPASLSSAVITGVLRQQLGFSGLVLTDSLSAVAISKAGYTVPAATVLALKAGADMVLYTASASNVASLTAQTVQAIVNAVGSGQLPRDRLVDAVTHILATKRVNLCG